MVHLGVGVRDGLHTDEGWKNEEELVSIKKRIEIESDDFLIELLMVLVDRLDGDTTVSGSDLERIVDGVNELTMNFRGDDNSLRLRVQPEPK
jgi:hypothetical protein